MTERMNQTIKKGLAKTSPNDWDLKLPDILWNIRTTPASSTKFSPYQLMYAKTPITQGPNPFKETEEFREKAKNHIIKAQERQKKYYDKGIKDQKINIGDHILIWRSMIETNFAAKLEPKWEGPYLVTKIQGTSIFIKGTDGRTLKTPIHINRTKKYYPSSQ